MEQPRKNNIELSIRLDGKKKPDISSGVSFTTYSLSENKLDELAVMEEILQKFGVSIEVKRYESTGTSGYDIVTMKVDEKQYKKATTRHAGRKANFSEKYDKYNACTVKELQEKLQTMTKTKIAEELGCPRMTLYRILKNIEQQSPDGSVSIWHYTS